MSAARFQPIMLIVLSVFHYSCDEKSTVPSKKLIADIDLKRGSVISCGPWEQQLGSVDFKISGGEKVNRDFNHAIKLLHSFEYDEAEKVFAKIIDEEPGCAMAYWGVAMSNFHPLWTPPSGAELKKGIKAIDIAKSIPQKSKREAGYIEAVSLFYQASDKIDHHARCISFEKAMEKLHLQYHDDKEAAAFYALALTAAADPSDKSFSKQKKAGDILTALYPDEPNHPGIVHYIIHTYDSPDLAELALPAAKRYASVAPSSAHALHMPSHIFTRLGLWEDCINSNLASVSSAQCYAEEAGIKGHWDEELYGLDYLVYAYLQKGDNAQAKKQWDYIKTINAVDPLNFKVAYAFAAIPSRYLLENKMWKEAANLKVDYANVPWQNFPWQKAIIHFTRLMGSVHTGTIDSARVELDELKRIYDTLVKQKDIYKANQVQIQIKMGESWIQFSEGKHNDALQLMSLAVDMESKTEKHPVTPGEVIPAGELSGDMLLQMNKTGKALESYEADLKKHPNRFNGLYGAGLAAEKSGDPAKAALYYRQLLSIAVKFDSNRPELKNAMDFLDKYKYMRRVAL